MTGEEFNVPRAGILWVLFIEG